MPVVAQLITWWTLAIEAALAVAFLCPERWQLARRRHALLLLFLVTAYPIATVTGFAWVLIIFGVAQCRAAEARTRLAYLGCFLLLFIYESPWPRLAAGTLRRLVGSG
jgi:hypothetical protein